MPTLGALILALVTSRLVEGLVRPYVSVRFNAALTLVAFFGVAFVARRWLLRLRDGE